MTPEPSAAISSAAVQTGATGYLEHLDFPWPGNVRHIEQLAARLTTEHRTGHVAAEDIARLLDARGSRPHRGTTGDSGVTAANLDAGLPSLLEGAERSWLEEALRRYPRLTRAELAEKLRISGSSLYKKLKQHGIGG